jgi:hypothetical protein
LTDSYKLLTCDELFMYSGPLLNRFHNNDRIFRQLIGLCSLLDVLRQMIGYIFSSFFGFL